MADQSEPPGIIGKEAAITHISQDRGCLVTLVVWKMFIFCLCLDITREWPCFYFDPSWSLRGLICCWCEHFYIPRRTPTPAQEQRQGLAIAPGQPQEDRGCFFVWLLSLSIMFSGFIHAVACIHTFPFYGWIILHCMDRSHLFIHLPADNHLGCLHIWAIMNNVHININIQVQLFPRFGSYE